MNAGVTVIKTKFILPSAIRFTDAALMREIGLLAREAILRRTERGVDVDGQPFQAYGETYAKRKDAALGATGVNLKVSGRMLDGLTIVEVTEDSVTLGFTD